MTTKNVPVEHDQEITPASSRTKLPRRTAQPKNTTSLREALGDITDLPRIIGVPGLGPAALEIGQMIRRARASVGMTQIDLAKAAGLTQGALSDIELGKGKEGPSYRILRELWQVLNPKSFLQQNFADNLLIKPNLLHIATLAESTTEVSTFSPSVEGLIRMLLDQEEASRVCSKILATIDSDSVRASRKYDCMMWRIPPRAHTRIATHDLTVFLGVSGAVRVNAKHTVDSFDQGCIVLGNETVEVVNPAAKPLSFLSIPAVWFLSACT